MYFKHVKSLSSLTNSNIFQKDHKQKLFPCLSSSIKDLIVCTVFQHTIASNPASPSPLVGRHSCRYHGEILLNLKGQYERDSVDDVKGESQV
mmetsp:Transcript_5333/g.8113  ORF Transcript_5333/g.8113 Transcript_5333/m.8113 type:complete len:92 (-) Transcript_5333:11-286(-)